MKSIHILYSTTDGQTKKICHKIQSYLKTHAKVSLYSINDYSENFDNIDLLIIGASIRYGKHSKAVQDFILHNKTRLERIKSVFFSVNLVARKAEKNTPQTNPYMQKFFAKINWKPNIVKVFAGKLDYSIYSFTDKIIIKLIMKITNGPTKSDKPIEFTNWQQVEEMNSQIVKLLNQTQLSL